MTCADVEQLRDAFVDAELPGPMLLAVARHAGGCAPCDDALRTVAAVREAVARVMQHDADALDLSGLWPKIEGNVTRVERRRAWRSRALQMPAWAAVGALAAGALLWWQSAAPPTIATRIAARPNQAVIERLSAANNSRVSLRRERKNGTMLIMVNADGGEVAR